MSLDRSLKTMQGLMRHRNVLNRAERLKRLTDEERWEDSQSVFGLPKVANRNLKVGKKAAKKEEEAAGAEATAVGGAETKAKAETKTKEVKKGDSKPKK